MRRFLVLFLLLVPVLAQAQSVVSIPSSQCVWHPGNNAAWKLPTFDDSGWKAAEYTGGSASKAGWYRCRVELSAVQSTGKSAIAVNLPGAYEVYLDGRFIGSSGDMKTGTPDVGGRSIFLLPAGDWGKASGLLALHAVARPPLTKPALFPQGELMMVGGVQNLKAQQNSQRLAQITNNLPVAICYGVIGVISLMLFGLYLSDRNRLELLLLGIGLCLITVMRLAPFFSYFPWHMGSVLYFSLVAVSRLSFFAYIPFFFRLVLRRVPWFFRIVMVLAACYSLALLGGLFLPSGAAVALLAAYQRAIGALLIVSVLAALAPFFAFWPWKDVAARMRPIAILCMIWALIIAGMFLSNFLFSASLITLTHFRSLDDDLFLASGATTTVVLIGLLALLFRDQRRTAQERAVLAGEMQAAQEIQRMLVPTTVETVPGLKLEVAFQPMRDVGGDFCQCRILPDGMQRILLGDVSGKGAAAAMTAAVLIGASGLCSSDSPKALLHRLNEVLCDKRLGGFTTCLCADISANGFLTVANAGHLSPYRNGDEVEVDSGLPLGVTEAAEYTEKTVPLAPGDTLTFLSDGVIEARSASGELFGFERTREISRQSAEQIAQAARQFGQEDDITVLTLQFTRSEAAFA